MNKITTMLVAGLTMLLLNMVVASAQEYPGNKPITMIFTFGLGSQLETMARTAAEEVGKELGAAVVLENRAGGGGLIGLRAIAAAQPDGYTIAFAGTSNLVVPPLAQGDAYPDFVPKLVPVVSTWSSQALLLASAKSPFKSMSELIEFAKQHPGKIKYIQTGVGSSTDLLFALLAKEAGIEITPVPYAGLSAAIPDLLAGSVDVMITAGTGSQYLETGELIGISTFGSQREENFFPKVPTISEAGLPQIKYDGASYGILAPAGTPPAIVQRLNETFNKALRSEPVQKVAGPSGMSSLGGTPEEMKARLDKEKAFWTKIITDSGVTAK